MLIGIRMVGLYKKLLFIVYKREKKELNIS